ncbi:MAG: PAS domain S-box protein, partial [Desulfuromonadales bacterium]|nr:PAS domain S-box protein [Desulfuromonadales bacterium]
VFTIAFILLSIGLILQILLRRKSERNLIASEARFKQLSNLTIEGIVIHNKGVAIDVNESITEMFGYTRDELIGTNLTELLITPEYHATIMENIAKPTAKPYEVMARKKDGTLFPIEIESRDITREIETYRATALRDLTERKKVEVSLQKSEQRLRQLFDDAVYGIALADPGTGVIIDCNSAFADLLKRDMTEIVGKSQSEFHAVEEQTGGVSTTFKKHLGQESGQTLESRMITSSGETIDVEIRAKLIDLGDKQLVQGFFKEITERKQAEKDLIESQNRFSAIMNQTEEGITVADMEGHYTYVNPAFCKMMGYSNEELLQMTVFDMKAEDQETIVFEKSKAIKERITGQVLLKRKDGTEFFSEVVGKAVEINNNKCVLGIVRDITEYKLAEQEREKLEAQLSQTHKMEAVGTMAGGIAHDFN